MLRFRFCIYPSKFHNKGGVELEVKFDIESQSVAFCVILVSKWNTKTIIDSQRDGGMGVLYAGVQCSFYHLVLHIALGWWYFSVNVFVPDTVHRLASSYQHPHCLWSLHDAIFSDPLKFGYHFFMSHIVLYFLQSISVLSFYVDIVWHFLFVSKHYVQTEFLLEASLGLQMLSPKESFIAH